MRTNPYPLWRAALELAAGGFCVFPLVANSKKPLIAGWPSAATTDRETVSTWWAGLDVNCNVGIATGPSGLCVIDLDMKNGADGLAAWRELRGRLGLAERTRWARTPSGGWHIYYKAPAGHELRNTAGRLGAGIDTRAAGGFVVGAGSVINGRAYTWGEKELPICWLPAALVDLLEPARPVAPTSTTPAAISHPDRYVQAALDRELQRLATTPPGKRHDQLNTTGYVIGTLVGSAWAHVDYDDMWRALWDTACAIGLDTDPNCGPHAIERTITNALTAGMAKPRPAPIGA